MNKTLIAMAVAGVMAAPTAAMADATVYGKVHVSVDFMSYDSASNTPEDNTVLSTNSSRIGFKGSEDLGGGMKAIWKLESGIAVDGETGTLKARNRYVGLSGGWGTLLGGIHDTPMKSIGRKVELFPEYLGDHRNLMGGNTTAGWDLRTKNTLAYVSPKFGQGFGFSAAYVFDHEVDANVAETDDNNQTALSANVTWTSGNWFVGAAYESHDRITVAPSTTESESAIRVSAAWTPGAWKVIGLYHTVSAVAGTNDYSVAGLGAAYKMGKNVIKAQYYMRSSDIADADSTLAAVAWDYKFSKRTTAYIAYAVTDNDNNANRSVNSGGHSDSGDAHSPSNGEDPSGISIGMIHNF